MSDEMRWRQTACSMVVLVACSGPPFIDLPNPLLGQVTDVTEQEFVVTAGTGERYVFINANPEDEGMGQAHMRVHLADRTPVLVTWRREGYELVAVRVSDGTSEAPGSSPGQSPGFPFGPP